MENKILPVEIAEIKKIVFPSTENPDNYVLVMQNGEEYLLPKEVEHYGEKVDTFEYIKEQAKLRYPEIEIVIPEESDNG